MLPSAAATGPATSAQAPSPTVLPRDPTLPSSPPIAPSWTPRPAEDLLINSRVSVQVARLNVRARPTIDAKIRGVLERGDILRIADNNYGPFSQDGYAWYAAAHDADGLHGWIAVGMGDTSYVKRLKPRCPTDIHLAALGWLVGSELLACFGDNSIELTGTFGCADCRGNVPGSFSPAWLADPVNFDYLSVYPFTRDVRSSYLLVLHFPPGGSQAPPVGSVIRVHGHFDDPAAQTCDIRVSNPLHPATDSFLEIPAAAAHLACAQQFVVESYDALGTDSMFWS